MNLNMDTWKEFKIGDLFDCYLGKSPKKEDVNETGKYPVVSAQSINNGICGYTDCEDSNFIYKESLTLGNRGTYLCLYHPYEFFAGNNVIVFKEKEEMNQHHKLFISVLINNLGFSGYDNYPTKSNISKENIKLPAKYNEEKEEYEPDWEFIEKYIEELEKENKNKSEILENVLNLNPKRSKRDRHIKINLENWHEFELKKLFKIKRLIKVSSKGGGYVKDHEIISDDGSYPYVAAVSVLNGVKGYTNIEPNNKGNCITFSTTTDSATTVFYQPVDFVGRQQMVGLYGKKDNQMNIRKAMFLIPIIRRNLAHFNYDNKLTYEDVVSLKILLPAIYNEEKDNFEPDWEYMEEYVRNLQEINRNKLELLENSISLDTDKSGGGGYNRLDITDWHEFRLPQIFSEIKRGTRLKSGDRTLGKTPLITAGEVNNGLSCYIEKNDTLFTGRCLTIDMFGNTFYRDYDFYADDNIIVFKNDKINESQMLFLASVISKVTKIYSYKEQFRLNSVNKAKILLPAIYNEEKDEYEPDWEYMENYIEERKRVIEEKLRSLEYE